MSKIRVLVADDHAVLRTGLRLLINTQDDLEVVGEAGNHDEALRRALELRPDVLTLDVSMPMGTAAQVTEALARECLETRVLILTMHDDPAYLRVMMAAGAFGYVVKKAADSELLTAIRTIASGKCYAPNPETFERINTELSPQIRRKPGNSPLDVLSEREQEVLRLVVNGLTNQAIADKLELSVKTVESYRARVMAKLGLRNRAELMRLAIELGIVQAGIAIDGPGKIS